MRVPGHRLGCGPPNAAHPGGGARAQTAALVHRTADLHGRRSRTPRSALPGHAAGTGSRLETSRRRDLILLATLPWPGESNSPGEIAAVTTLSIRLGAPAAIGARSDNRRSAPRCVGEPPCRQHGQSGTGVAGCRPTNSRADGRLRPPLSAGWVSVVDPSRGSSRAMAGPQRRPTGQVLIVERVSSCPPRRSPPYACAPGPATPNCRVVSDPAADVGLQPGPSPTPWPACPQPRPHPANTRASSSAPRRGTATPPGWWDRHRRRVGSCPARCATLTDCRRAPQPCCDRYASPAQSVLADDPCRPAGPDRLHHEPTAVHLDLETSGDDGGRVKPP